MGQIRRLLGGAASRDAAGLVLRWRPGEVAVEFSNGRSQRIRYELVGDLYVFRSEVARPAAVGRVGRERLAREILLRNRAADVVAFRFTKRGGVEGVIEQRASTLQPEELRYYLAQLAREADRFEFALSDADSH